MNERIDINKISQALIKAKISPWIQAEVGVTKAGNPKIDLQSKGTEARDKIVAINDPLVLSRISDGDVGCLIEMLAKVVAVPGDLSAMSLLRRPVVRSACISELEIPTAPKANFLRSRLIPTRETGIPVFYGSTAGINFAEVLETALCCRALLDGGTDSQAIFDFESQDSPESQLILKQSRDSLASRLREQVDAFIIASGGLAAARLQATKELCQIIDGLPSKIDFTDVQDVFSELGDDFTLGQLLILARIAGSNPRLFSRGISHLKAVDVLAEAAMMADPLDRMSIPVVQLIDRDTKAAGFTFYARDARIGQMGGVFAIPFKLTDKANIYKIMIGGNSLFNPQMEEGMVLMPITRSRILLSPSPTSTRPVDPVVLRILSREDPAGFQNLAAAFRDNFKVLTPEQALATGTNDRQFKVEDYLQVEVDND